VPVRGKRASYRPVPHDFPEMFVKLGWAGIERHFHCHTRSVTRWLAVCGREELVARRAAFVKERRAKAKELVDG
jgi:hypothetical protein